jgi:hypothetical protein
VNCRPQTLTFVVTAPSARAEGELAVVGVQAENERAAAVRADAELAVIRARRWWWRLTPKMA